MSPVLISRGVRQADEGSSLTKTHCYYLPPSYRLCVSWLQKWRCA